MTYLVWSTSPRSYTSVHLPVSCSESRPIFDHMGLIQDDSVEGYLGEAASLSIQIGNSMRIQIISDNGIGHNDNYLRVKVDDQKEVRLFYGRMFMPYHLPSFDAIA